MPADEEDWATEYGSLDLAVRVVADLEEAVAHIERWSTGHTEAILTRDVACMNRFVAAVDSAAVMVNASTRFTEVGVGASLLGGINHISQVRASSEIFIRKSASFDPSA